MTGPIPPLAPMPEPGPEPATTGGLAEAKRHAAALFEAGRRTRRWPEAVTTPGTPGQALAACCGPGWRLVCAIVVDESAAPDIVHGHVAVLTDGTDWMAVRIAVTERWGAGPEAEQTRWGWTHLTPGVRVRVMQEALVSHSVTGPGMDGLLHALGRRLAQRNGVEQRTWLALAVRLLTDPVPGTDAGEVTSGRFLFALSPHPYLHALVTSRALPDPGTAPD